MAAERPDKQQVRMMWGKQVEKAADGWSGGEALYLTLAGANGYDIRHLVDIGLIETTETGAVADSEAQKVIAVERGVNAYTQLRERFPGLTVLNDSIESLAGGDEDTTVYPAKRDKIRKALRARVVNLDYNQPLVVAVNDSGWVQYPQLTLVQKLAQLHASVSPVEWILLLTLNGQIEWPTSAHSSVREYLAENISSYAAFAEDCRRCLGEELVSNITELDAIDFGKLTASEQQLIIAALVPKKIATSVHNSGWRTTTVANWTYGGVNQAAPMCTWATHFTWDSRTPGRVYQDSLATIFSSFAAVSPDGKVVTKSDHTAAM
jgi:hypothetical protein